MSQLKYFSYSKEGLKRSDQYNYNQSVRIPAGADRIEISGQAGWDPQTGDIPTDIAAQISLAFSNVELALRDAGGKDWEQVFKVNSYHTDMGEEALEAFVENLRRYAPHRPLLTAVAVPTLADPKAIVEIEVVAVDV
ncbi:YjgF-like protein [Aulographum hederae CBS 113979]|uniref:YjgF-like protein n=1 Tax=Aulographum hederae CBS 113979 TaxID=1176131 RepID=A0A6G1H4Y4_9PEZI|nr:YjgF-like protein [Aulographum hederae CBS 113979]